MSLDLQPRRDIGASGSLVMPVLTAEQFYAMRPVQLRAVFELAENVEHIVLWSARCPRDESRHDLPAFMGVRGVDTYNRVQREGVRSFTGWNRP